MTNLAAHKKPALLHRFTAGACDEGMRALSAKIAGLADMAMLGLPVPPGFVLGPLDPDHPIDEEALQAGLDWLEAQSGRRFGETLLLAARAGDFGPGAPPAALNIGAVEEAVGAIAVESGDAQFAQMRQLRLLPPFAALAYGLDEGLFEDALEEEQLRRGAQTLEAMDPRALSAVCAAFARLIEEETGAPPPLADARGQLEAAIEGFCNHWRQPRARALRALASQEAPAGPLVIIQQMAFGDQGPNSGAGQAASREAQTGAPGLYGDYLDAAQGDALRAGLRAPRPLSVAASEALGLGGDSLERRAPDLYEGLKTAMDRLERHYADMSQLDFINEQGALRLIGRRPGRRTPRADLRIAADMAQSGVASIARALLRIDASALETLLHPTVDPDAPRDVLAHGLPASPGAATGRAAFSPQEAEALAAADEPAILIRAETSPEDIGGMYVCAGVLTARGGMTCHAAVVARGLGKPCICGATDVRVDAEEGALYMRDGRVLRRGDILTIDGGAGEALLGAPKMITPEPEPAFAALMQWADERRRLEVRANADSPAEAALARKMGAQGVGLCRTEHAFFEAGRLVAMREMILANGSEARKAALAKLEPMHRADFRAIYDAMPGLPVTIRLIDPPLHEFLSNTAIEAALLAEAMGLAPEEIDRRVENLREFNPMLGRRGCRLGIAFPEIYAMQTRAILTAALESGAEAAPDIMFPLVSSLGEMKLLRDMAETAADEAFRAYGARIPYRLGAVIETPRAALLAGEIAKLAEFLSFGTNDLTQMTYGLSRDDAGRFIANYVANGAFPADPFHTLDREGVGELMRIATMRARAARPDIIIGVCGEHGGAPDAFDFWEELRLDYISCSPYRAPTARLAAAQARLRRKADDDAA